MRKDPVLKTRDEIENMRRAARVLRSLLANVRVLMKPGVRLRQIESFCVRYLDMHDAEASSIGYNGFPSACCTSLNDVLAHGVPDDSRLADGDVLSLDVTCRLHGWMADTAWTYCIGECSDEDRQLVQAAWDALRAGVGAVHAGGRIGSIGNAILRSLSHTSYVALPEFSGHGIGRDLHEEPGIPVTGRDMRGAPIVPGMVLNLEPVVAAKGAKVMLGSDGVCYRNATGERGAQFELSIAVRSNRVEILQFPEYEGDMPSRPPF